MRWLYENNKINAFLNSYKKRIFDIFNSKSINSAKKRRDDLINEMGSLPTPIYKIMWDLIIPYFKKLTYYLLDENVEPTNNKIENIFQKNFNKSIKKKYKTDDGILKRFDIRINNWNEKKGFF